ncbi:MAG: hypothetical protein ACI94Y_002047 [Maribacter sp.]|jgi:hypothetical protein
MKNFSFRSTILLVFVLLGMSACKDDDNSYAVPTTYNFENVSYPGQTDRLGMLAEVKSYISSVKDGEVLDAGRLAAMYSNESAIANWTGTYGTKQLRSKTSEAQQAIFDALLTGAATDSQIPAIATEGTAGLLTSLNGEKTYFVNARGMEYAQIVEKGLMGAVIMYQQTGVYLEAGKMAVDNTTITEGEGTDMEHHWDESFGYYGVPLDFPTTTDGVVFWGDYCNDRDEELATNTTIMNAYLKGRAAISNNDLTTRDEQIDIIQAAMDEVAASTAIHYINSAINNFNDPALRAHALSEAAAFYYSVQFNPATKSSSTNVNTALELMGGSTDFMQMNFWAIELNDLETAKDNIANIYAWDAAQADRF